jgi:hypothetical protein
MELYISAFDSAVTAAAGMLPEAFSDDIGTYNAVFNTTLPLAAIENSITITRDGGDVSISSSSIDWTKKGNFSISSSVYHGVGNAESDASAFYSVKNGILADSNPILTDDYLGYIAKYELGSQYLVGAFQNVDDIISGIQTESTYQTIIDNALIGRSFNITQLFNNAETGDNSALWVIYSSIFRNSTERIIDPVDGATTCLLKAGDVLVMKLNVTTPDLDPSITAYGPDIQADSPLLSFTPTKPAVRSYKIRITLV